MLPKAHLTLHSRMSGSRSVITPSWLSASWRPFWDSSFVYSRYLFLISSASLRSIAFLSFIVPIFAWSVLLISLILLKRSLVFPILLFSSISFHWSLRRTFLSLLAILWNSAFKWVYCSFSPLLFFCLLFSVICKTSSDEHFAYTLIKSLKTKSKWCFKWYGKIIVLKIYQWMTPSLFLSPLSSNLYYCFISAPFQDQPNLIASERQIDKVSLWWVRLFFSSVHRPHYVWIWQTPLPVWRSRTRTEVLCICAARHTKTLNPKLEAELSIFV